MQTAYRDARIVVNGRQKNNRLNKQVYRTVGVPNVVTEDEK